MKNIGLLNGPNLDRLGKREPDIYGSETLEEIVLQSQSQGNQLGCEVHAFQSNHEGALIDKIHQWADLEFSGLILNPWWIHPHQCCPSRCDCRFGLTYCRGSPI